MIALFILGLFASVVNFSYARIGATENVAKLPVDQTIFVNNRDPRSNDSNPGTVELPFKTLAAACKTAVINHDKRGFSTKIIVYPGIYREGIGMEFTERKRNPVVIIEAKEPGRAIVSGADLWTDWEKLENGNIYVHTWPYKWGLKPYPKGWEGHVALEPIVRRREMVFIGGKPVSQVLAFSELHENTFFVSEEENKVYLFPPSNTDPSNGNIEVATRYSLLAVKGKRNFALKGLRFQHAATGLQNGAVWFSNSSNVLIEDCIFTWNNWTGYILNDVRNVTSKRNVANYNGGSGFSAWKLKDFLSEDDETSHNNWRGERGQFVYWAVSGAKVLRVHDAIIRRHIAKGNHTGGYWLDVDNKNIRIEDSQWCGNLKHGLFIEASQGPITITKTKIYQNKEFGIRGLTSRQVNLIENQIYDNGGFQIKIEGSPERSVGNWETGKKMALKIESWKVHRNIIQGGNFVLDIESTLFVDSINSDGNIWHNLTGPVALRIGHKGFSLTQWQEVTALDSTSILADPAKEGIKLPHDCPYLEKSPPPK